MKSKKWKDIRTGEIVTQFNILDIQYMEEYNNDEHNRWGIKTKNFRLNVKEVEIWDRMYIVKAKSKTEAIKKLKNGEFEDGEGETTDTFLNVISVEEE